MRNSWSKASAQSRAAGIIITSFLGIILFSVFLAYSDDCCHLRKEIVEQQKRVS